MNTCALHIKRLRGFFCSPTNQFLLYWGTYRLHGKFTLSVQGWVHRMKINERGLLPSSLPPPPPSFSRLHIRKTNFLILWVLTASGDAMNIFLGSWGRAGFYSLNLLKTNPCSRLGQWNLKHLTHTKVSYKQWANPNPFKMVSSGLGEPFQQLPFVTVAW